MDLELIGSHFLWGASTTGALSGRAACFKTYRAWRSVEHQIETFRLLDATSSFLPLVVMYLATSSFLLLVAMHLVTSSFLLLHVLSVFLAARDIIRPLGH